ncbi:MAG: hypothetical protein ISS26_00055 [Candidatus Omnitrophica bacterium]|nr:hypothetical protein [Candidatus Omnitrophota bacterium]
MRAKNMRNRLSKIISFILISTVLLGNPNADAVVTLIAAIGYAGAAVSGTFYGATLFERFVNYDMAAAELRASTDELAFRYHYYNSVLKGEFGGPVFQRGELERRTKEISHEKEKLELQRHSLGPEPKREAVAKIDSDLMKLTNEDRMARHKLARIEDAWEKYDKDKEKMKTEEGIKELRRKRQILAGRLSNNEKVYEHILDETGEEMIDDTINYLESEVKGYVFDKAVSSAAKIYLRNVPIGVSGRFKHGEYIVNEESLDAAADVLSTAAGLLNSSVGLLNEMFDGEWLELETEYGISDAPEGESVPGIPLPEVNIDYAIDSVPVLTGDNAYQQEGRTLTDETALSNIAQGLNAITEWAQDRARRKDRERRARKRDEEARRQAEEKARQEAAKAKAEGEVKVSGEEGKGEHDERGDRVIELDKQVEELYIEEERLEKSKKALGKGTDKATRAARKALTDKINKIRNKRRMLEHEAFNLVLEIRGLEREHREKERSNPDELKEVLDNPQATPEEKKIALERYQDKMHAMMGQFYSGGIIPTFDGGAAFVSIPTPEQIRQEEARRIAQQRANEATWRAIGQAAGAISNAINQSGSGSPSYHPSGDGGHPSGD